MALNAGVSLLEAALAWRAPRQKSGGNARISTARAHRVCIGHGMATRVTIRRLEGKSIARRDAVWRQRICAIERHRFAHHGKKWRYEKLGARWHNGNAQQRVVMARHLAARNISWQRWLSWRAATSTRVSAADVAVTGRAGGAAWNRPGLSWRTKPRAWQHRGRAGIASAVRIRAQSYLEISRGRAAWRFA